MHCLFVYIIAVSLLPSHANAEANCENWDTIEYFRVSDTVNVERCLAIGVDPNARISDTKGSGINLTVLHAAAMFSDHPSVINILIAAGADPLSQVERGITPIHMAGYNKTLGMIEALLDAGHDASALAEDQVTPLHTAARLANAHALEALLNAGADVNARAGAGIGGITPLHAVISAMGPGFVGGKRN